mmetsp:Transcript_53637/g.173205  ORF Transcript_53637/g.173205 Transcript_53637/m.173205 type:complete len:291 (+) Transcript_53637:1021-1893(+)
MSQNIDPALAAVRGSIWVLSQCPEGSRAVQRALEGPLVGREEVLGAIADELRGYVSKAARCPHANHVLQKLVASSRPEATQFVVDELLTRPCCLVQTARHRYGCRIVQQLLRHCHFRQTMLLAEELIRDAASLSCHPFGHYVIRCLLECGVEDQCRRVIQAMQQEIGTVARSTMVCGVIVAGLENCTPDDALQLARTIVSEPGLLRALATKRSGDVAMHGLLRALPGPERDRAVALLLQDSQPLLESRHGRVALQGLLRAPPEAGAPPKRGAALSEGTGTSPHSAVGFHI